MVVNVKIIVFWDMIPYNLGRYIPLFQMEVAGSSETFVPIYQIMWYHIPASCDLKTVDSFNTEEFYLLGYNVM
jgi:hypothetical protein